jgi:hypothetical protein
MQEQVPRRPRAGLLQHRRATGGEDGTMRDVAASWTTWMPLVSLLDELEGASLAWVVAVEDALAQVIDGPLRVHQDGFACVELLSEWRQLERELNDQDPHSAEAWELRLHVESCRRVYRDSFQVRALPH